MAVLTNTMMQGTAAISDAEEDYQIEKSIRLSRDEDAWFTKELSASGNRRIWTWSAWVKRPSLASEYQYIWGYNNPNGQHGEQIRFQNTGQIWWYQYDNDGSNYSYRLATTAKYRDTSAWYHIVAAFDSTHTTAADRCRLYVNGIRVTQFDHADNPSQNLESSAINRIGHQQGLGRVGHSGSTDYNSNCYLSDVQFIDGLALSPAAFGEFDSESSWVPKAFAQPAPNTGITWSDSYSGTAYPGGYDHAKAFNGDLTNGTEAASNSTNTWTPPSPIVAKSQIRISVYCKSNTIGSNYDFKINGATVLHDVVNKLGAATQGWYTLDTRTLTSLQTGNDAGGNQWMRIYAIEVDGVLLIDGQTDATAKTNPNDGKVWSNYFTGSFHSNGQGNAVNTFDGSLSTQSFGNDSSTLTFLPPQTITAENKIEIYVYTRGSITGQNDLKVNNTSIFNAVHTALGDEVWGWYDIGKTIDSTNGLVVGRHDNDNKVNIRAIKVDGTWLLDSVVDNSFHLKFNDTTASRNLGYSQLGNTPTGAQPMYGPGADDSAKSSLVFAMPGYDTNDHHHTIKGSGSAKSVTANGDATTSSTQVKFYDKSLKFDGTGDYLEIADGTDWDFGTGDFTVELWVYPTNTSGYVGIIGARDSSGWGMMYAPADNYKLKFYTPTERASGANGITVNKWQHVAVSRSGTTIKGYVNGIQVISATDSSTADGDASLKIGTGWPSGMSNLNGYLADIRIYKGTAKYTSDFIPPNRNDWKDNNLSPTTATTAGFKGINHCVVDNYANQNYNNTNGNPSEAWIGTVAEVAAGGFFGVDRIYWIDLGEAKTIEKFVWNLTSDGNSGAGTGAFILFYTDNPASTGSTRCSGGCTVNTANTFSGSMTGSMTVTHDWGSGNAITNRYIGLSNGSGGQPTHWKVTGYTFTDANDGPPALEPCSFLDSPTNYEDDSGVIHGNYPTLNHLQKASGITLTKGNLCVGTNNAHECVAATMGIRTGKWYWEMTRGTGGSNDPSFGIKLSSLPHSTIIDSHAGSPGFFIRGNQARYWDNTEYAGGLMAGVTQADGETLGFAFDADAGKIWARKKDGTWANSGDPPNGTGTVGTGFHNDLDEHYWLPCIKVYDGTGHIMNFGATPFKHTIPTGFKAICTQNFDDTFSGAQVNNPSKYFDIATYRGNATSRAIKNIDFQPDFVWIKARDDTYDHAAFDSVRGANKRLRVNQSNAEGTDTQTLTAFNSDGYTTGTDEVTNKVDRDFVAWMWDCGTAAATASTDGSVTPSAQWKNATAGFSMSKFTGTGSTITVGHGLGAKPEFILQKCTSHSANWNVWHKDIDISKRLVLNSSDAESTGYWNSTEPTNTVVTMTASIVENAKDYMLYCFTSIIGFSAFGKYTGNGNADGPFIYTGFRPKFIIQKMTDEAGNWALRDVERAPDTNPVYHTIIGESTEVESNNQSWSFDFLSNGFKVRTNQDNQNKNNGTFIYAAWAENPFKTARAR